MINALEKAKLIQELRELGQQLEQRNLSLYDIARCKKRIGDIFESCNEPIFKKQNLAFKTLTQPEVAAYEFVADSIYALSFRGFFLDEYDLEKALYLYPDSGWAFLFDQQRGWQIWLIPAPNRTALISEWTDIEQSYHWLLQEQQQAHCLKTDAALKASAVVLSLDDAEIEISSIPQLSTDASIETSAADILLNTEIVSTQPDEATQDKIDDIEAISVDQNQSTEEQITSDEKPHIVKPAPSQNMQFGTIEGIVSRAICFENEETSLYHIALAHLENTASYVDVFLNSIHEDDWQTRPIYLAEQLNAQGEFKGYMVLIGALDAEHAQHTIHALSQQQNQHVISIKQIEWNELQNRLNSLEALFKCYQYDAEPLWQYASYYPYMPASLLSTQKYMLFEEATADRSTPILLLQERQKLRLIHGENRLALQPSESCYPYLIVQWDKTLNWQTIHSLISNMPKPISVYDLYDALTRQATD